MSSWGIGSVIRTVLVRAFTILAAMVSGCCSVEVFAQHMVTLAMVILALVIYHERQQISANIDPSMKYLKGESAKWFNDES